MKSYFFILFELTLFRLSSYKLVTTAVTSVLNSPYFGYPFKFFFKRIIFTHFCAGENFVDAVHIAKEYNHKFFVKTILDHSTEDLMNESELDYNLKEKISLFTKSHKINLSNVIDKSNSRETESLVEFIPLKCSSLIHFTVLEKLTSKISEANFKWEALQCENLEPSVYSSFDNETAYYFRKGIERLKSICKMASESNISILLDAEQSYRQPAIELIYMILATEFNSLGKKSTKPAIYNTYQCYLKRTENILENHLNYSKRNNIAFAVKLVRGAYMQSEYEFYKSNFKEFEYPIHATKVATDDVYNRVMVNLIKHIGDDINSNNMVDIDHLSIVSKRIFVMIATHNHETVNLAINTMIETGLWNSDKTLSHQKSIYDQIVFAQIKGMSDSISFGLGLNGFHSTKLVTFGNFDNLLPWLIRRLHENQDGLGSMKTERKYLWKDLLSRSNL
eukprot:gene6421-8838_t